MIDTRITWCAHNRVLVFIGALALALWGAWAMRHTPLDAMPDLSDVQVIIATEWPGRSPDLIEDQITYPIVTALVPTPKVRAVRGFTDFGVSYVYVIFEDGTDIYWARSRVLEYLQGLRAALPRRRRRRRWRPTRPASAGCSSTRSSIESGGHTLDELRSLQDWTLRYGWPAFRGVAEVASIGGFVKQYQVNLDPDRLSALHLSPSRWSTRFARATTTSRDGCSSSPGREYMVRARGYLTSLDGHRADCARRERRRHARSASATSRTCASGPTCAAASPSSTGAARSSAASSSCASARTRCA